MNECTLLDHRRAGILLHPTSLPGPYELGDIGYNANKFIDLLSQLGMSAWQVLPLSPTHSDLSPYDSYSAHAGNANLISLEKLCDKGWLDVSTINKHIEDKKNCKQYCLEQAYNKVISHPNDGYFLEFNKFKNEQHYWLEYYALFVCLRRKFANSCWQDWPTEFRECNLDSINEFSNQNEKNLDVEKFIQFVFYSQWNELKSYANQRDIIIIGDIPLFVSLDSADVWSQRSNFYIDDTGKPIFVAGVPPDYFSDTGQRWGNPHYRWDAMQHNHFSWWVERIRSQHTLYDVIRIDHFRGLSQYWEIPACEETAQTGQWVNAPGEELLNILLTNFPGICFLAEDLGTITDDVLSLRDQFNLPGMRVLQFAFDGNELNPHLPKNYTENSVAYTGTHDNNTTMGWYNSISEDSKQYVHYILKDTDLRMPWSMIDTVMASVANTVVIPMQDILELDENSRMNIPGVIREENWRWRFDWHQLDSNTCDHITNLVKIYDRTKN